MVKQPVTITMEPELDKRIRTFQAKLILDTNSNWSYSKIVEIIINEGLKSFTIKKAKKNKKIG